MSIRIPVAKVLIGDEEKQNVGRVLDSGMLAHGEWVKRFEGQFAEFNGSRHALSCSSGTAALDLALRAIGITEGDEVIVPDFTFIATANAVLFQKARPVFADVLPDTFCIDPEDVQKKITAKTKAIIAVHLFGQIADMKALSEICEGMGIKIIEDACQSHGAEQTGVKCGNFGSAAAFSFYPTKNMTTGEGGMVTTNDDEVSRRVQLLRNHGQSEKYYHTDIGFNFRMTNLAAAIGMPQLERLPKSNAARQENAGFLTRELEGTRGLVTPKIAAGNTHVFHQYVVKVEKEALWNRERIMEALKEKGIGTAVHYPIPIHMQPCYQSLGYEKNLCPVSMELSAKVMSLPVHPGLSREDLEEVASAVKGAFS